VYLRDRPARPPAGAEEHYWRAQQRIERGSDTGGWVTAPENEEVVGEARVEVLYRQLRKAFEDGKNEPGAADFYYGEMEMRRAGATRRGERVLLWLYWVNSGYALRARRALIWLALTVAASIIALTMFGFPTAPKEQHARGSLTTPTGPQPLTVTLRTADPVTSVSARAEKATEITLNAVIFRSPDAELTTAGRYLNIAIRILGPLLGLSVLAIRNQVKR
jgi:hypothetical protein